MPQKALHNDGAYHSLASETMRGGGIISACKGKVSYCVVAMFKTCLGMLGSSYYIGSSGEQPLEETGKVQCKSAAVPQL